VTRKPIVVARSRGTHGLLARGAPLLGDVALRRVCRFIGAAELDTKVRLAVAVNRLLESRRLTQAAAATALSINQPKISALKHYKLEGFSVERLMTFLTTLGGDVEIRVHLPKRPSSPGRILVNAA
jgi:predicted XRE-type DNA-binding protein